MLKISLSGLAVLFGLLSGYSQHYKLPVKDTSDYKERQLKFEEINIVTSFYSQDGNHSAVTGGLGTERLNDNSNTFELKLFNTSRSGIKHHYTLGLGFDHYTSASSDKIDTAVTWSGFNGGTTTSGGVTTVPGRGHRSGASSLGTTTTVSIYNPQIVTSASFKDNRFYPSLAYSFENPNNGLSAGLGINYSTEYDYQSRGAIFNIAKASKDKNTEIGLSANAFFDTWLVIYPAELRPAGYPYGGHRDKALLTRSPRNSYSAGLTWSQVVNKKFQFSFMIEPSYQEGLLGTKYQRVYFEDGTARPENMPSRRTKLPMSFRGSLFISDWLVLRPNYRFYTDSWHLTAHTVNMEASVKANAFLSFIPFYRYHTQNGVPYFAPYKAHSVEETYFTSDYDLSKLSSQQYGLGIRVVPLHGVMGIPGFNSLEVRYANYVRSDALKASMLTAVLTFK